MTRMRYEHPASRGCPTPFPKIITFIVLPRPPGISSVFSALPLFASARLHGTRVQQAHHEVRLVQEAERCEPFGLRGFPHAGEVDVGGDVPLTRIGQPRRRRTNAFASGRRVTRKRRQGAGAVGRRIEVVRLVPVVDQDDEPAGEPARDIADPFDGAQVDFSAPPGLERNSGTREVVGQRRCGRRPLNRREPLAVTADSLAYRIGDDVDLAQPVLTHHDLVHGHGIQQLVGDEHSFKRRRQRVGRGVQPVGGVGERRPLGGACGGARLDEMQPQTVVQRPIPFASGAEDVCREPAVARAGFDEVEAGIRNCGIVELRISAISAICTSSSSPNIGPTSTLVKKSPARPERRSARA